MGATEPSSSHSQIDRSFQDFLVRVQDYLLHDSPQVSLPTSSLLRPAPNPEPQAEPAVLKHTIGEILRGLNFDPRGKGHFDISENGVLKSIDADGQVVDKIKLDDKLFEEFKASRAQKKEQGQNQG
ncbi:hypothetical protein AJ79_09666 [Helicocarpus griseus UAMH5409]|uniref:Uncharacterized protein n=1 Tax=Helicocarpus griseus UAMH5409 TaxID=1447875 RepID=A0A2B7WIA8_9EURO|nr:hypothetical protein AJ79_09666 [Helicocarpus griseus UAMH5409]